MDGVFCACTGRDMPRRQSSGSSPDLTLFGVTWSTEVSGQLSTLGLKVKVVLLFYHQIFLLTKSSPSILWDVLCNPLCWLAAALLTVWHFACVKHPKQRSIR